MGDVYDAKGELAGSVNAWSGAYDRAGRKVGHVDIFRDEILDENGRCVGRAHANGEVHDLAGNFVCSVAFFGSDVTGASGSRLGSVGIAGAPDPRPDMQWRGAAALLLLIMPNSSSRTSTLTRQLTGKAEITFFSESGGAVEPTYESLDPEARPQYAVKYWIFASRGETERRLIQQIDGIFPGRDEIFVHVPPLYLNRYREKVGDQTGLSIQLILDWLAAGAPVRWAS